MNNIYQYVFENVKADKLDKYVGAGIINLLRHETAANIGKDIAIIGISFKLPKANNMKEFWDVLQNGEDCIGALPDSRKRVIDECKNHIFGRNVESEFSIGAYVDEIDKFDCMFFKISPTEANLMDPNQRLFLQTAWNVFEDAGYSKKSVSGKKIGVYVGYSKDFDIEYKRIIEAINPSASGLSIAGNIKSIIGSRISYTLDLRGPSMLVDTACSSALVSVHLACRAIRNGECEMAIAGGSKVIIEPGKGDEKTGLGILSSIGRARTFDDSSDGTGIGEGIAAVLLKPLNKAIEDRDNIYAVIKGTAVNQDGSSIGITAPNSLAQEDVITSAWKDADIDPETITYIEAHGTGTPLGDPIEIDGMEGAFRKFTGKKQFCAVGSVKTNVGHLDHTAGMAGLIKAVLALKYRKIPPSLHLNKPNRKIIFEESPVYINDRLSEWETNGFPRRCGISSFGLSGTNCHIVIEEAPLAKEQDSSRSDNDNLYVFTLSAKSRDALIELAQVYEELLKTGTDADLADICYTQNTGRNHYNCRLAFILRNREELKAGIEALRTRDLQSIPENRIYFGEYKIVTDFKKIKDEGEYDEKDIAQMSNDANTKIKEMAVRQRNEEVLKQICHLYVKGADIEWEKMYDGQNIKKVSLPGYSFERRQCWVQPESPPGNPGSNMNTMNHPLLDSCLAESMDVIIFSTKFNTDRHWVLAEHRVVGNFVPPGTTYLEMVRELCERRYPGKTIQMEDVIFTSPLVVNEFEDKEIHTILKTDGNSIEFTIVSKSGLSGAWAKHAEGKVFVSDTGSAPVNDINAIRIKCNTAEFTQTGSGGSGAIETGPRWDNIKKVYSGQNEALAFLELPEDYHADMDEYGLHPSLLDCSVNIAINSIGEGLYLPFSYKRLKIYNKMPAKVISHVRKKDRAVDSSEIGTFDITLMDVDGKVFVDIEGYSIKKVHEFQVAKSIIAPQKSIYHKLEWTPCKLETSMEDLQHTNILIFSDETGIGDAVAERYRLDGRNVVTVGIWSSYQKISEEHYLIGSTEEDYRKLLEELKWNRFSRILNFFSIRTLKSVDNLDELDETQRRGVYSLFYMARALIKNKYNDNIDIVLISDYVNEVNGTEKYINPHNAPLFGLGKVVGHEYEHMKCRCLDIDGSTTAEDIISLIGMKPPAYCTAIRKGSIFTEEFGMVDMEKIADRELDIKYGGVYIITGGTGGIGLEIGRYLASKNRIRLILVNRSKLPEREKWDEILNENEESKVLKRIKAIKSIEDTGTEVVCFSADVSVMSEMKSVLDTVREKYGKINGIIHGAGVAGNGFIMRKDEGVFSEVIAPKIQGTWILDKLCEKDELDFFIMFSSISTLLGERGQGDYTAANYYLDSFAAYRNRLGKKTLTVNWGPWKETGMAADYKVSELDTPFLPLITRYAVDAFDKALNKDIARVFIGELNFNLISFMDSPMFGVSESIKSVISRIRGSMNANTREKADVKGQDVVIKGKGEEVLTESERTIAKIWAKVLGLEDIDVYENFMNLGGDSILAGNLLKKMDREYKGILDISDIFAYPSVVQLAGYIDEKQNSLGKGADDEKTEEEGYGQKLKEMLDSMESGDASIDSVLDYLERSGGGL